MCLEIQLSVVRHYLKWGQIIAKTGFRNTLQLSLGGPWLQPKAKGALIAFLLLSHLSKPSPFLSLDLQTRSPPWNPGHQTNTDQHLLLLASGSSPRSCQHRKHPLHYPQSHCTSPTLPWNIWRDKREHRHTGNKQHFPVSCRVKHSSFQPLSFSRQCQRPPLLPVTGLTCLREKLRRNKDMSCTFAQGCVWFLPKMQPEVEFATQRLEK